MRIASQLRQVKCMGCGKSINAGFFCARCVEEGAQEAPRKPDGIISRFNEERRKRFDRQMMKDDLMRWAKRLGATAASGLVLFGGWHFFGDRIEQEFREAADVVRPNDRNDPSKKPVQLNERGNIVGTDKFSRKYNQ